MSKKRSRFEAFPEEQIEGGVKKRRYFTDD
jgi:hypothetical protein